MNSNFKTYISKKIAEEWAVKEKELGRELSFIEFSAIKSLSLAESKRLLILSNKYNAMKEYESFREDCIAWLIENKHNFIEDEISQLYDSYYNFDHTREYSFNDCMDIIYSAYKSSLN